MQQPFWHIYYYKNKQFSEEKSYEFQETLYMEMFHFSESSELIFGMISGYSRIFGANYERAYGPEEQLIGPSLYFDHNIVYYRWYRVSLESDNYHKHNQVWS